MKDKNNTHLSGKRKRAVARATIKKGTGKVMINGVLLENYEPAISRSRIKEALFFAHEILNSIDIIVRLNGGGISSQAESVRLAVARALAEYTKDSKLETKYLGYDRHLLIADVRRKEKRKPNRHGKARAKRQKSYR